MARKMRREMMRERKGTRRSEEAWGRRKGWRRAVYLDGRRNGSLPSASAYITTEQDAIFWQFQLLVLCLVSGYCSECLMSTASLPFHQIFKKYSVLPTVVSFPYSPSCNFCNCSFVSKNSSSN